MTLGYAYNDGGLNNQKMALLGLMATAYEMREAKCEVALPDLYNHTVEKASIDRSAFSAHFYTEPFYEDMAKFGISVVPARPTWNNEERIVKCGWGYFKHGSEAIRSLSQDRAGAPQSFVISFLRSLISKITHSEEFSNIASRLFLSEGVSTVVQLRIERDWITYSANLKNRLKNTEDYCIDAEQIIEKTNNTLGKTGPVYVTCNEKYLPRSKNEIRQTVKAKTGTDIIFKSDIISESIEDRIGNLALSILDFEIAKMAPVFVGLSRSTFANMLALERFAADFNASKKDYIYNIPGSALGLRTDFGTQVSPEAVVKTAPL